MKTLSVSLGFLAALSVSTSGFATDNLGDKFNQALQSIGTMPHASIVAPISDSGTFHNLNAAQLRSRLAGDELFTTSNLLIAGTQNPSEEAQTAVCRSTAKGLNLLLGSESLPGFQDLAVDFDGFREVDWTIRRILECDGSTAWNQDKILLQNQKSPQYCLNLNQGNDGDRNNVYLCNPHPDQAWTFHAVDGEWFQMKNDKWGKCLALEGDNEGRETVTRGCNSEASQQWRMIRNSEGNAQLQNRAHDKCLALKAPGLNAPTQVKNCRADDSQQIWALLR